MRNLALVLLALLVTLVGTVIVKTGRANLAAHQVAPATDLTPRVKALEDRGKTSDERLDALEVWAQRQGMKYKGR